MADSNDTQNGTALTSSVDSVNARPDNATLTATPEGTNTAEVNPQPSTRTITSGAIHRLARGVPIVHRPTRDADAAKDPTGRYVCTVLDCVCKTRTFETKEEWACHMDWHESAHRCEHEECAGQVYYSSDRSLVRHRRMAHQHNGGPIRCPHASCQAHHGFECRSRLDEHMARRHKEDAVLGHGSSSSRGNKRARVDADDAQTETSDDGGQGARGHSSATTTSISGSNRPVRACRTKRAKAASDVAAAAAATTASAARMKRSLDALASNVAAVAAVAPAADASVRSNDGTAAASRRQNETAVPDENRQLKQLLCDGATAIVAMANVMQQCLNLLCDKSGSEL